MIVRHIVCVLKFIDRDLKLSKCYQTLQDYKQKQGKHMMIVDTIHELHLVENGQKKEIPLFQANQMRVLVDVPINIYYEGAQIIIMLKEKTQGYIGRLSMILLRLGNIMCKCQHHWQPALKCPSLALLFTANSNLLDKLYVVLLPKQGVVKTFPTAMRSALDYLGGLNLHLAEVEALVQVTHHFISPHEANTPTYLLLQTLIEYHSLELGADKQLFILSFKKYSNLATKIQIILL